MLGYTLRGEQLWLCNPWRKRDSKKIYWNKHSTFYLWLCSKGENGMSMAVAKGWRKMRNDVEIGFI